MDPKTFKALKQVAAIIDRIKYTGTSGAPADVTLQTLAALFELDEVLLGGALYSSAKETKAGTDFTAVDIWETHATKGSAFLYYRPPGAALETPSAGYCFNWRGSEPGQSQIVRQDNFRTVKKWWENKPESWMIRASERIDAKVVSADAGYLFYDTIVTLKTVFSFRFSVSAKKPGNRKPETGNRKQALKWLIAPRTTC